MDKFLRERLAQSDLPYIAFFDNCGCEIDHYGEYQWLLGLGDENAQVFDSWEKLLSSDNNWKMGILPYHLKNLFEKSLKKENLAEIPFSEVAFFVPQLVAFLKKGAKEVEFIGDKSLLDRGNCPTKAQNYSPDFQSNFSKKQYLDAISTIRKHIEEGDFYELNFTQRFLAKCKINNPFLLFQKLITISPVPFAAYIRFKSKYLLCASPERFLKLSDNKITSQPIKGTAKRGANPQEDELLKQALRNSIKEQAENVMIVDLTRNDIYRSSVINSVTVPQLFEIQTFPQVHQMVSSIVGEKRAEISAYQVIKNAFPPGSMTGAPKVKVMDAIQSLETVARGAYSGSAGFFTPHNNFDFNVIIRSLIYDDEKSLLSYHVGGAITYDSVPEEEYQESLLKANAIRQVFAKK